MKIIDLNKNERNHILFTMFIKSCETKMDYLKEENINIPSINKKDYEKILEINDYVFVANLAKDSDGEIGITINRDNILKKVTDKNYNFYWIEASYDEVVNEFHKKYQEYKKIIIDNYNDLFDLIVENKLNNGFVLSVLDDTEMIFIFDVVKNKYTCIDKIGTSYEKFFLKSLL